jgi:hypothetical protein
MTRTMKVALVLGVLVAMQAGRASADSDTVMSRAEIDLGTYLGTYAVGEAKGFAGGVHGALGWRLGPLRVLGEGALIRVGDNDSAKEPIQGTMTRIGLTGRYSVFTGGEHDVSVDVWVEGGVGRELVRWDGGGELTRDDAAIGFGVQPRFRAKRGEGGSQANVFGYLLALRMFVANDPGGKTGPTCAGPCDRPTRAGRDIGFLFNWSFTFGR